MPYLADPIGTLDLPKLVDDDGTAPYARVILRKIRFTDHPKLVGTQGIEPCTYAG
jgi:hypothetical protein